MKTKDLLDEYVNFRALLDLLEADRANAIANLLTTKQKRELEDVHFELDARIERAEAMLEKVAQAVKKAVVADGEKVSNDTHQVSFVKGRVAWDTAILEDLLWECPAIKTARKRGKPYAIIKQRK